MAKSDYNSLVQKFYVAYFGRPADAGGLLNMTTQLDDAGAPSTTREFLQAYGTNATVKTIVDSFGNSAESAELYSGNTTDFVTAIYRNVLGRTPDVSGLTFWVDAIDHGGLARGRAALNIMEGAENNTSAQGRIDAALVANRIAIASTFTDAIDTAEESGYYAGSAAAATGRAMLSGVGATTNLSDYRTVAANALANMATRSIGTTGEVDNVTYSFIAGHAYRIEVNAAAGSSLDPEISQVVDTSHTAIPDAANADYGISSNAQLTLTPSVSGDYTIAIRGQNNTTGDYVVKVTDLDAASTDDSIATIAEDQSYSGTIQLGFETRSVFFELTAGHEYHFALNSATSGDALDTPVLRGIYDDTGKLVASSSGEATNGSLTLNITPATTGTYYGVIADVFDDTGAFTFSFTDVTNAKSASSVSRSAVRTAGDDYAASTSTTGSVAVGGSTTGNVETNGDQDWGRAHLDAGRTYQFNLRGVSGNGGTLFDPVIDSIRDTAGTALPGTYNDDSDLGFDSQVTFTPTTTGDYFLVARSIMNSGTGTYTLSLDELAADDYAANSGTTGTVAIGGTATGNIGNPGDQDWFAVNLTAGTTYTIRMQGQGGNAGTLYDPLINGVYYNFGGGTISSYYGGYNNDSPTAGGTTGRDASSSFTPYTSGTYYIAAASYGSYTGTYSISVTAPAGDNGSNVTLDTIPTSTVTPATVAVGGSVTGTIDSANDADWYGVDLAAGHFYTIQLQGSDSGNGTLRDPLISGLYTSAGSYIFGTYSDNSSGADSILIFSPTTSGRYYIAAEGHGNSTGTFQLSVQQNPADVAASTSTSANLTPGGSANVSIDSAYDHDWYGISLVGGTTYLFSLTGSGFESSPVIYGIYNSNGAYIEGYASGAINGTTASAVTLFTPATSGTYFIDAYASIPGHYTLTAVQAAADISANTSTTGSLSAGESTSVTINQAGDHDWYGIALTAGNTYQFTFTSTSSSGIPWLYGLYNASGSYVGGYFNWGGLGSLSAYTTTMNFSPTTSGTYYIDAYAYSSGTYTLSAAQVTNDIAASTGTTGTVTIGGNVNGTIDSSSDADWYKVSLTAGTTYTIQLQGSASGNGTLSDPLISGIYNAAGALVSNTYANDQNGRDSALTFTPTISGEYYIAAEGYGSATGTFRLSVTQSSTNDLAAGTETDGVVLPNSSTTGMIESAGDIDWFAVDLTAGTRYRIDLKGASSLGGSLYDPYISGIYTSNGELIAGTSDDDSGTGLDSSLTIDVAATGRYYIGTRAHSLGTGSYTLSVATSGTADITGNVTTTGTIGSGGSVTGSIDEAGDRDWYALSMTAGQTYTIDLQSSPNSTDPLLDPLLSGIYTNNGTLIAGTTDDDSGTGLNAHLVYTAPSTGTYYISAAGYGNYTGSYLLNVSSGSAGTPATTTTTSTDIAATTSTAGRVSINASASGRIDTAGDQDWFQVNLSAGHSYNISVAGADSGSGTLTDPYLRGIYDSNGTLISGTTDNDTGYGRDALVAFSPSSSGTYYVAAGANLNATGGYTLTVSDNSTGSGNSTAGTSTHGTWTVMVYVDGDNNLEDAALADVNEMEAANLPEGVRVSTLLDRAPGYSHGDGNWTDTRFGLISHDNNVNHVSSRLASWGERNMGSTSTLTEFINASVAAAPADHYALVIWDHGGGIRGVAWDDTNSSAHLSLNNVRQAVAASSVTHFDMIGFDACLQGVLDQAYALRNQADYLVVSEDLEPGDGWDYTHWLSIFQQQSNLSSRQVATQAVGTYESFFQQYQAQVTLSAIDERQIENLASAWSSFAQAVNNGGSGAMQSLRSARSAAVDFDNDYVDLHSLMSNFMRINQVASLDNAAQNILNSLGNIVVDTGGLSTAHGLTVYMPEFANSSYLNTSEFPLVGLSGVNSFYASFWA